MEVTPPSTESNIDVPTEAYQENINPDISSETRENLGAFEQTNWDNLSQSEKEQAVEKLRDSIAEDLQLENKPNIAYYNNEDRGDYGGYAASTNTIYINRYNMGDATETVDTIAHESRHCWQHERADNPQTEQDYRFKENFDNYVRPEDDYREYKNQIVESDAREYATLVREAEPIGSLPASDTGPDKYVTSPQPLDVDSGKYITQPSNSDIDSGTDVTRMTDDVNIPLSSDDINIDYDSKVVNELPDDFESKEKTEDYSTKIDDKVKEVEKDPLPAGIVNTFKNGEYRTVVTTEPVTLYRVYGGAASAEGSFCTTEPCVNKAKTQDALALKNEWGNTISKEAQITVPAGTKLNIGRVAPQNDGGKILKGDADQIILPQNWDQDWVSKVRNIDKEAD